MLIRKVKLNIQSLMWKRAPAGCAALAVPHLRFKVSSAAWDHDTRPVRSRQRLNGIDIRCLAHGKFQIIAVKRKREEENVGGALAFSQA